MTDEGDDPPPPGAEIHDIGEERKRRKRGGKAKAEQPVGLTDEELAQQFVATMVAAWRFVPDWDRVMLWDGGVWARDEMRRFEFEARAFCAEVGTRLEGKARQHVMSGRTISTVSRLAKCDPALTLAVDDWDCEAMEINCDGIVMRLDGEEPTVREVMPTDFVTKTCAAQPAGDCPLWLDFLAVVTGGDDELVGFLQRLCGYLLTGSTDEQVLIFLYGPGGNGKSTFINTIAGVMGDYAVNTPMDMLGKTNDHDRHPTELARLHGARLVTANETAEGRRWDESRLKQLTGGDVISARFMGRDFFDFRPAFKLVVSGNHKPELRGIDDALKRRVRIVPFTVTIPEEKRISGLDRQLKREWPGILAWMVRGAEWWREIGLKPPFAVMAATADYFEQEDLVGAWLDECTQVEPERFETNRNLFASWKAFCMRSGELPRTQKLLTMALVKREDLKRHKRDGERGFFGRRIKDPEQQFFTN